MKDYLNYGPAELIQDDQFFKWVKYPGLYPEFDEIWQSWLAHHPDKSEEVEEARRLLVAILEEGEAVQVAEKQEEGLARLRASLDKEMSTPGSAEPRMAGAYVARPRQIRFWRRAYGMAASVLVLMGVAVGWWVFSNHQSTDSFTASRLKEPLIMEVNNGSLPKTILLADGSSIILQSGSTLEYPKVFKQEFREVILTGEGFFEISKDPQRPFFVYTDQVVTKVLGTSFNVRAIAGEKDISVSVRTGKVSVFTRLDERQTDRKDTQQADGVLLVPNQQAIFSRQEAKLTKSLVENPAIVHTSASQSFEFRDAPLTQVFASLKQAYGVDIIYDEELMSKCFVNVSLGNMSLYDKLRVICKTVGAEYQILDLHIVVTGKGCQD